MPMKYLQAWPREREDQTRDFKQIVLDQLLGICFGLFVLLVFFLVAFPSYGELKIGGSPNLAPSRLLRLAILGILFLVILIKPLKMSLTYREDQSARILYWTVAAFWLWVLPLVLFNAASLGYTFSKLKNEILPVWISFWLAAALIKQRSHFDWLVKALVVASVVVVGVTAIELVLRRNVFDGLLQVENISTKLAFIEELRDGRYRAKGTFQHPLVLAHFYVSLGLFFVARGIFDPQPIRQGYKWWLLGAICLCGVYFTNTRSGLAIGAVFGLLLLSLRYLVWLRGLRNQLMGSILRLQLLWLPLLAIVSAFVLADLMAGRSEAERSSTSSRLLTLANALNNMWDSPLIGFGVGIGESKGGTTYAGGYMYTVDNLFLLQTLDNGIPAALLLLACFVYCAWRLTPRWRDWRANEEVALRVGILFLMMTTVAMYFIYALTDLFELCFVLIGATLCLPDKKQLKLSVERR